MRKKTTQYPPKAPRSYLHRILSTKGKMRNLLIQREYLLIQLKEVEKQIDKEDPAFNLYWKMEEELNGM